MSASPRSANSPRARSRRTRCALAHDETQRRDPDGGRRAHEWGERAASAALLWYDSAEHGQRRYYKGIGNTLQPEFTSEKPQARVLADLDHAFSVMALCKREATRT